MQKKMKARAKAKAASDSDNDSDVAVKIKIKDKGPLFEAHFHRIILDEAHTIKNRNAKMSKAACEINAKYRWW